MMPGSSRAAVLLGVLLFGLAATPAGAEIVRLSNGRVMTVESCRFDGDIVTLQLRGGGEIRAPKSLIAELLPDEVPYARTVAIEALALSKAATSVQRSLEAIRALVDRVATRVGVDLKLAHAVVSVESKYNPLAISSKGAMGLMQIMPVLVKQYGVVDPFDAERNLDAGLRHLRSLLERYDTSRALAAYNAGEGAVARYGGQIPPYRETQDYVDRIRAILRKS
jgi:soluble lytic murein transglycosylase-like protein